MGRLGEQGAGMSEMVERVGLALYVAGKWIDEDATLIQRCERLARAAIEAMREPTEAMILEAYSDDAIGCGDAKAVWQHMIDEALKGPSGPGAAQP